MRFEPEAYTQESVLRTIAAIMKQAGVTEVVLGPRDLHLSGRVSVIRSTEEKTVTFVLEEK